MGSRRETKIDKTLGQRAKSLPFDAERRAAFLLKVEDGASISQGCRLIGISRETVANWLQSGRSAEPKHPEHVRFTRDFDRVSTEGIVKVIKSLREQADEGEGKGTKAALAYLQAMDSRFGDRALKKRKAEVEIEKAEIDRDRARESLRIDRFRADVAEAAARKAKDEGVDVMAFGLTTLLGADDLPLNVRQEIAAWAVRNHYVLVERPDWSEG